MTSVNLISRFRNFSALSSWCVFLTGGLVLAGWLFNIEVLKVVIPGLVAMNPLTAVCFVLTGVSIKLCTGKGETARLSIGLMSIVLILSMLKLLTFVYKDFPALDDILFHDQLTGNKMAPNTAFNFLMLSLAFLCIRKKNIWLSHSLLIVVILIGWLAIIGYLNNVKPLYGIKSFIPMALHTAFTFIIAGLGVLYMSSGGVMSILTSESTGGKMSRNMLPVALLVPPLFAWLRLEGERKGLYNTEFGTSLFAISLIFVFVIIIILNALLLTRLDEQREEGEKKIIALNEELKESLQEVEHSNMRLQETNTDLETFTFTASHDLKSPLRHIIFINGLLQDELSPKLNEEEKKLLNLQEESAKRMNKLIENLLEFFRISSKDIQKFPVPMGVLVDEVIAEIKKDYPQQNIELHKSPLPDASGNASLIRQVWMNLISNAVKYSSKKETSLIKIGSYTEKGSIVYFIKDNGVGFDMVHAHKLFTVFQRLHSGSEFSGTGLGLSIAHRIIKKHGGTMWAEGKPNEGACFYFSLPV